MTQILIIAVALVVPGCVAWIAIDQWQRWRQRSKSIPPTSFSVWWNAEAKKWQPAADRCDMVVTLQPRTTFGRERVEKFSQQKLLSV